MNTIYKNKHEYNIQIEHEYNVQHLRWIQYTTLKTNTINNYNWT